MYTFRLTANCTDNSKQFQDVVITVQPITIADAGTDITSCPDSSGNIKVSANAPEHSGEIGEWIILGDNNAGLTINFPNSPTTTLTLPETTTGVTTLQWTVRGPSYGPGQFCESSDSITVTNYGGEEIVSAGPDQSLDNCYTVSRSTTLNASFGGNGLNGQQGSWSFVSGPSTPSFANVNNNRTTVSNLIQGSYTLRWTVAGQCVSGQDTMTITVDQATQDISNATVATSEIRYCDASLTTATLVGSPPTFSGETVQWRQTGGSAASILNDTSSTTQVTGLSSTGGPYTFSYTITNASTGCADTAPVNIIYSTAPISITGNGGADIVAQCGFTEVDIPYTFSGSGTNSYAIISGPSTSTLVRPNNFTGFNTDPLTIDFDVEGTYAVLLRRAVGGSLKNGCDVATDVVNVTVSRPPSGSNAGTPQTLSCSVTSTSLVGNVPVIGKTLWSQISGPNTATISDAYINNPAITGLIPGTYIFKYTVAGGVGCSPPAESTVSVEVSSNVPIAIDAGPDQTLCFGTAVQLAADTPPAPNLIGTWTVDLAPVGATIVFEDENDPNTMVSGLNDVDEIYRLVWTVGNPNDTDCPSPASDMVTITTNSTQGPTPADAGPDQCLLSGATSVTLEGNAPAADESGVWTAVPDTGISFVDATRYNTSAEITIEQSYVLTWTIYKTTPGCQTSYDDVEITLGAPAVANAGADQVACSSILNMAATASIGGSGTWTQVAGPGGVTMDDDTSPNAQFSFSSSGEYVFEWTVSNGNCSLDTDQVTLIVGIPPTIAAAGSDQQVCNATNTILSGNAFKPNIETGYWSLLSGAPNTPHISDVNDPNTAISNLVTGSYTFRWTILGSPTCPSTYDDMVIDVFAPANAGNDLDLCEASNFLLEATFGSTGTWTQVSTTGANAVIIQNPSNSNVAEVSITPGNTYVFRFTTDYASCPNLSDEVTVTTSSAKPSIDPDAGADQVLCRADLVPSNTTTLLGNVPPADVDVATWRFASVPSGSVAVIDDPNNNNTTLSGLSVEGIYIVEWNFSSGNCSDTADVVRIEVFEAPSIAEAGTAQSNACQLDVRMAATPPAIGIGTWTFAADPSGGAAVIDSPNSPTTTISNITTLGTYQLTWTVTNGTAFAVGSCSPSVDTVDITFTEAPPSSPEAGPDQQFCDATQTNLDAVSVTNGIGTWSQTQGPGVTTAGKAANITSPNNPKSLILDLEPGIYEFSWTVENGGCSLTDSMEVEIISRPVTANAGMDQVLHQFSNMTLNAGAPTIGAGKWTQVSGPTTASFVDETDPNTNVFGIELGVYEFQWTVSNGICKDVFDTMIVTVIGKADLELTKSVSPTSVNIGDRVTFTISLFNNDVDGQSNATGVSVRDAVPDGYSVVLGSVSNDGVYNPGNFNIIWEHLSIANGSTLDLTFDAIVNASGSYDNTAEITASDQFDPDSSINNNVSTEDDQDTVAVTFQSADLSLAKTVSPTEVSVGDLVTFTLTINNAGTSDATGVALSDVVPAGYTIMTINNAGTQNGNTIDWSGLSVASPGSTAVSFTAMVNAPTGSVNEYKNVAQITSSDQLDPNSTPHNDDGDQSEDDEDSTSVTLKNIDLELTKSASSSTGNIGDRITIALNLANSASENGDGTGITVVETLPSGFTMVAGTITQGGVYNPSNNTITWSDLALSNGADLDLTYDVIINDSGNYTGVAEITARDLYDVDSTPNNGNATEDDYAEFTFTVESADLSLVKNISGVSSATPNVGDTVIFELTLSNAGPNTAANVRVEDFVPRGYTLVAMNNGGTDIAGTFLSWNIPSLGVGTTVLSYEVTVNAPTGDRNEYLNTAEIAASDQLDPNSTPGNAKGDHFEDDEDFFEVFPQIIDLELDITVNSSNPNVGDIVTFSIALTNNGDVMADGVGIQNRIPTGFGNITVLTNGGAVNGDAIDWTGLTVPVGSNTLILTFTAEVLAPTGVPNEYKSRAQVTHANQFDSDSTPNNDRGNQIEDDEDSVEVTVQMADLSIEKTANTIAPNVGDMVQFTLTITNASTDRATGVAVEDILPSGYRLVSVNNGGTALGNTALWTGLSVLGNGGKTKLTYSATVEAPTGAVDEYLNIAQITASDQFDPDSDPLTGVTVDEDGNGDGYDDDETSLNLPPAVADLSLTKTVVDNNSNPKIGSEISFEITVFNDGPNTATNVAVEDILASGFKYIVYSATSGIYSAATGIWNVGDIPSGKTETLIIDVLVKASGTYTNVAEVIASDVFDPNSTPNNNIILEDDQDSVVVEPVALIDLSLHNSVNNKTPDVGENIIFTLTVTNDGPSDATNVQVMDQLPNGFTYVGHSPGEDYNAMTGNWNIGNLASGTSIVLDIEVTVAPTGNYRNDAQVIAHNELDIDSSPNNNDLNEDDQEVVVVSPRSVVDVSVTKTASTLRPNIGSTIDFTVTVTNDGPSDATNVVVTDQLQSGYAFVNVTTSTGSYEALNGSWTVGNLAHGTTENMVITATVLANGNYTNTAELTDLAEFDIDSRPANNDHTEDDQATVDPLPVLVSDLSLNKSVNNMSPKVGEYVEFIIDLTNSGPNDARGVVVTDQIPTGYTYVSHNTTSGKYDNLTGIWNLNRLVFNNTTETLNIIAKVNPTGNYNNVAEVTASDNSDPNSTPNNNVVTEDDQAEQHTVPIPIADLSLTKTVDNMFPDVSDNVTFTLTVFNDGPSEATGIVVTDLLESGYAYISDDSGNNYNSITGLWAIGNLATGESVSLEIVAGINTTGSYANVAEITAVNELDPDSTPNNAVASEDDYAAISTLPRVITDISVNKTVDNLYPSVGSQIVFTVSVTNDGPSDATGIIVQDFISSGYEFLGAVASKGAYTESIGSWDVGNVANGTTETLEITVLVLPNGNYTNTAELIALDTFDPDSTPHNNLHSEDDQATVTPRPRGFADLSLTKVVDNREPNVGDLVEFTISITNSGDSDATGVEVTDFWPVGYTYVSHITTMGIYNKTTGLWKTNGTIPNGTTETLIVLARVNAPTGVPNEYLNLAEITASDQVDPDSDPGSDSNSDDYSDGIEDDDEASALVVPQVTDIAISKTVSKPTPRIGERVVFTITALNNSATRATNIGIEELLPKGYGFISYSATNGVYDDREGFWGIDFLGPQTFETLEITVEVLEPDDYINTTSLAFVD